MGEDQTSITVTGYPQSLKDQVLKDYDDRVPFFELCRRYAVSHQTIKNWVKKRGTKPKNRQYDWEYIKKQIELED